MSQKHKDRETNHYISRKYSRRNEQISDQSHEKHQGYLKVASEREEVVISPKLRKLK